MYSHFVDANDRKGIRSKSVQSISKAISETAYIAWKAAVCSLLKHCVYKTTTDRSVAFKWPLNQIVQLWMHCHLINLMLNLIFVNCTVTIRAFCIWLMNIVLIRKDRYKISPGLDKILYSNIILLNVIKQMYNRRKVNDNVCDSERRQRRISFSKQLLILFANKLQPSYDWPALDTNVYWL